MSFIEENLSEGLQKVFKIMQHNGSLAGEQSSMQVVVSIWALV